MIIGIKNIKIPKMINQRFNKYSPTSIIIPPEIPIGIEK